MEGCSKEGGSSSEEAQNQQGVLLYYKYVNLEGLQEQVKEFYENSCGGLDLRGRVRVAKDGVNATLGGTMFSLRKHIQQVEDDSILQGANIDFKLATSSGARSTESTIESGFDHLTVKLEDEVVTLGPRAIGRADPLHNTGEHLSPVQFHEMLQQHSDGPSSDGAHSPVVLIDVRNCYETRIGRFEVKGVTTLDPGLRRFSDLPVWLDRNEHLLQGRHIMMYCTGGVRCERASAYVRDKGLGFQNVVQLHGGIQRYLEAFSDGGYFNGKNFVFDERINAPDGGSEVVGKCLVCGCKWQDYFSRERCSRCRMLVLVCDACHSSGTKHRDLVCEICSPIVMSHSEKKQEGKVLKILCLHGFRQTSKSFLGRTCALRKKLKSIAEFIFIDAPHELEFVMQDKGRPLRNGDNLNREAMPSGEQSATSNGCGTGSVDLDQDTLISSSGTTGMGNLGESQAQPAPAPSCLERASSSGATDVKKPIRPKRAWLISSENAAVNDFDELQYMSQKCGWKESYDVITKALMELGPFDGVMGFSQGACVAGVLCGLKQTGVIPDDSFRFAVIASGYLSQAEEHLEMFHGVEKITVPSLHIFGVNEGDRQISAQTSGELLEFFDRRTTQAVRHNMGHIIPATKSYVEEYKAFLYQFL